MIYTNVERECRGERAPRPCVPISAAPSSTEEQLQAKALLMRLLSMCRLHPVRWGDRGALGGRRGKGQGRGVGHRGAHSAMQQLMVKQSDIAKPQQAILQT